MNPLRSVGAQLSLALAVLVAGSLGVVYLFVVPSLERNLVNAKLSQLEHVAPDLRQQLVNDQLGIHDPDFVGNASAAANARVVLFSTLASAPSPTLQAMADSRQGASSADVEDDPVALRAATTLQMQHGTLSRGDERFAEVALPVEDGEVLLFSASLHDSLGNVHLVQHRLLIAGVAALLASLLLGFGGASIFARRIRGLERAADRIAGGRFDEPVDDPTPDELGQLARAFDRMRLRLAHLDRARAEFIANASHELRTPLFSLGGFLELLTDEELDDETRAEFLATMREQVERLARLAGDLLDLSRLDAGRLRVEREPFELADVARGLVEEFQALARTGERSLDLELDGAARALGDDERALRIGRALVENALRHTPPGTRVVVRAGDGAWPALEVEDDGPGIPASELGQVFDRFYRGDGSLASGSGLGLAIARELAERMSGRLEVESEPGRTVFRLLLPPAEAFSRENAVVGTL
ncbi:MAG: HAMP domain-containing protein [Actinobacteria bacterium]|nr:MAG: HAMP domain-containing protein [Actinomycetota bacterium]